MEWERQRTYDFENGKEAKAIEDARNAISLGIAPEQVHKITGLSLEQIEKIILETGNQQ